MARLDRLVTAKAVAQYASVIGRQFSYALLQTVSQLDEPTLQKELGRLVEAELIYQRGMPPQATYLFKHALVVDAAYQSLLKSTRQQYHQRIAQTLETRFPETAETQPELLAHHYTEAGLSETGIAYWQQAGERASERSAPVEAVRHFTKGLDLLATLPDRPERTQRELAMQMLLGPALMVTKGYAAPEVQQAYARARALCGQVADSPELFPVLMGLCRFYYAGGVMQPARELGEQLLAQAQHNNDAAWLVVAHTALGTILYLMGEFAQAHIHLEQGLASSLPAPEQLVLARRWGTIPSVQCLTWDALTLLFLGYPDQALRKGREARILSQELAHPHSVVYTLSQLARLHVYRRETQAAQELVETLIPLATEQGYALWAAAGMFIQGFTRATQGQHEDGVAQMSQSMSAVLATGTDVFRPNLAWLAEIYGEMGQADEGLHLLVEVISAVDKRRQHYYDSELYRLKGALLLTQSSDNAAEAESSYHKALDIARRQQAKFLELRAATSLARLWQSQGKRQAAYELLSPVYSWFTEGFDTADLKDAKGLLEELEA
jgi:predicted ATPase